jgi:glycosyltransferase involved in cell wall biosynthesis
MGQIRVTVAVLAYNAAKFIKETLDSLVNQTDDSHEIIVSDNHSTDDTCEIVSKYRSLGVVLVSCPSKYTPCGSPLDNTLAAIGNYNSLLHRGTGEYICIYHADDVYEPSIVKEEAIFMDAHPNCSAVFTMGRTMNEDGVMRRRKPYKLFRNRHGHDVLFDLPTLLAKVLEYGCIIQAPTVMIRRRAWALSGGITPDFGQAADVDWWLRLASVGPIGIINKPLYRRRTSPYQDSERGKDIYRYSELPIFPLLDYYRQQSDHELLPRIIKKFKFQRAGDRVRVAVTLLSEGRTEDGLRMLATNSTISWTEIVAMTRDYPRAAAQNMFGKLLAYSCALGIGRQAALKLLNNRIIFAR